MPDASIPAAPIDVRALREREFPHLDGHPPYLNAASVAPLPERARAAIDAHNARRSAVHQLRSDDFEPTLQRARAAAARLVNASPDEIALLPNTSYGINLAAQCLPLEEGRRIVVSNLEFPANVYPWVQVAKEGRARVDVVPTDALGRPDEDRLLAEIARGDVGIFGLSAVQFATGWNADLEKFGRACREHGTWFVVDAIQALGCIPVDVRAAEIDVLATAGHKWLCGPFGTGFAYVRGELVERMEPRVVGWTALESSADLTACVRYRWELVEHARRFEVGTQAWQDVAGFTGSVNLLLETGIERIRDHVFALIDPLAAWLEAQEDATIVSPMEAARRSGVFCFRLGDTERAYAALHRARAVCSLREGAIRIAPHLYNTAGDIGRVMEILERRDGW
ncbi:aminotransferase class V-fold PLP-dependent enzyme [Longimicrobium sp.]|uniref:aminotransferase class V-fold PLP-dependent enzyme n=1 Tax=Longimicrobium sp. TaxID=2029185 RepID=UPI002BA5782F|nr:aminotransferase class V-fold PLP-dependent enzyme [Longimicrobium sp.]HSU15161.1 aminotransferase class V-fold PLP-dependent enzyme [Longimicrobium sp.]